MKSFKNTQEAILEGHLDSVASVVVTSDNKYVVSGFEDKIIRIWTLQKRMQEAVWEDTQVVLYCSSDKR